MQQPDEVDQRVQADIERHGWHVVLVPPEADSPGWAHSIGLWERHQHPELLVFGSEPRQLGALVNALGERVRGGRRFAAGETEPGVLQGLPFAFRAVAPRWTHVFLGNAAWHYRSESFPALQGFWPDRARPLSVGRRLRARDGWPSSRSSRTPSCTWRSPNGCSRRCAARALSRRFSCVRW